MVLLADKIAPDIINNHLMRLVFSVGALIGLEMRALFKQRGCHATPPFLVPLAPTPRLW